MSASIGIIIQGRNTYLSEYQFKKGDFKCLVVFSTFDITTSQDNGIEVIQNKMPSHLHFGNATLQSLGVIAGLNKLKE